MILTARTLKDMIVGGVAVTGPDGEPKSRPLIEDADPTQMDFMEGGQYDLRLDRLYRFSSPVSGHIGVDERTTPLVEELTPGTGPKGAETWELMAGDYFLIQTREALNMPIDCRGIVEPRTTLFRCGLQLIKAGVAPNYQGRLTFGLRCLAGTVTLERLARVASITFHRLEGDEGDAYSGVWQGGRISTDGRAERPY